MQKKMHRRILVITVIMVLASLIGGLCRPARRHGSRTGSSPGCCSGSR